MFRGSVGFVIITVVALHANSATRERKLPGAPPEGAIISSAVRMMKANIELDAGAQTFASGLLAHLIRGAACRSAPGDLLAISSSDMQVWVPTLRLGAGSPW